MSDSAGADGADPSLSRGQRAVGLATVGALTLAGLYTLREFLPAIAWGVVVAIGVWPMFDRLRRRWPRHGRVLLPLLVILATLLVLVLPLLLIGVPILQDSHALARWIEESRLFGVAPPSFLQQLPYGDRLTEFWREQLGQPGAISKLAGGSHANVLALERHVGLAALRRLMTVLFMVLALFFLLRDADGLIRQMRVAGLRAIGPAGERVALQAVRAVQGTVNGLVLVGLAEGAILGIAYWVAGAPHPALLGLITGLLAMVPFGAGLAVALAALALAVGGDIVAAMVVLAFGMSVTFLADHFVRPVLIGGATRLPFLWVLFGILGGVQTWGLVGLFVGPALLSVLFLLWREYVGGQAGPLASPPS